MTECEALIRRQKGKETNACLLLSSQIKYIFFFLTTPTMGKYFAKCSLPPPAPQLTYLDSWYFTWVCFLSQETSQHFC